MKDIRALLAQEAPLVFDGATGTYFAARYGGSCELASLEQPEQVLQMHRAYLDAGCQAVKTNTFALGAMYQEGGESLARKAILAGCMLAREAAAPYGAYVFGDLGPVAALEDADPAAIYLAQAQLFLSQGITHFLLETLSSDQGVADFARQLKALCPSAFLLVSFGVQPDGYTREGLGGAQLFARMQACEGVDAAGFNCVCGPQHMLRQFQKLDPQGAVLSAMPNAGYPTVLGRRVVYRGQPDYFAQQGLAHGREEGDGALGGVGFVRAKDGVGAALFGVHVFHFDGRAENDLVAAQFVQIDDLIERKAGLDVLDAGLGHALPFPGGVIARIFPQVALFAGFLDGLDDLRALALETGKFVFQLLVALCRDGDGGDSHNIPSLRAQRGEHGRCRGHAGRRKRHGAVLRPETGWHRLKKEVPEATSAASARAEKTCPPRAGGQLRWWESPYAFRRRRSSLCGRRTGRGGGRNRRMPGREMKWSGASATGRRDPA